MKDTSFAYTVWPTDIAPLSAYWMVIKTTTYCSNSFSCGFIETLPCGVLIADHFFSHTQCPGAVHGFWSFYYGGKGPYLGVFPILQYKRPQGEEVFFLRISNLGWFGFLKAQFWWHGILQTRSGLEKWFILILVQFLEIFFWNFWRRGEWLSELTWFLCFICLCS